jgi:hypothetical protein
MRFGMRLPAKRGDNQTEIGALIENRKTLETEVCGSPPVRAKVEKNIGCPPFECIAEA